MPHIHEKIDFTAEAYVVFENKVLLRKHDKYKIWLAPGGHIELDEDPVEAAIREVKEEVGLDVEIIGNPTANYSGETNNRDLIPSKFLNRHFINDVHEHISFIYFARSKTDRIVQPEREKSDECRWFTREELDDSRYDIRPSVRAYATHALEELVN